MKRDNFIGTRFGQLTVIRPFESDLNGHKNNYKPGLTIDRINNDDGYYPENCRWTDRITQGNNTSLNRRITYREITKTIAQWARLFKMDYNTLYRHLAKNDMSDFEKHFNTEVNTCEESC